MAPSGPYLALAVIASASATHPVSTARSALGPNRSPVSASRISSARAVSTRSLRGSHSVALSADPPSTNAGDPNITGTDSEI